MAGAVDEVLVLLDRHLGVLRVRVDRLERAAPAQVAGGDPLPAALRELAAGGEIAPVPLGVGVRERARVPLRPHRRDRVELLELVPLELRDVRDLLVAALGDLQLREPVAADLQVRVRASTKRGPVERVEERLGDVASLDPHDLARLEVQ